MLQERKKSTTQGGANEKKVSCYSVNTLVCKSIWWSDKFQYQRKEEGKDVLKCNENNGNMQRKKLFLLFNKLLNNCDLWILKKYF